jgi:RNA polymerase sigma-70 factor (ECF subfamily)
MSSGPAYSVTKSLLEQELEEVFRAHYQMTYRTAYGITGNAEDAEDAVQTIFLRLLRRDFHPDLEKNPRGYLYRAAVNESLTLIRSRKRLRTVNDPEALEKLEAANPCPQFHELLYKAVAELNPNAAHILVLRYVHDYSDAEIAKLLGRSRTAIAVSLYRSRARLKKWMCGSLGDKS